MSHPAPQYGSRVHSTKVVVPVASMQSFLRFLTLDILLGQYLLENSFFPWVPSRDIYHFSKSSCCIWIISVQYVLGLGVIPSKDGLCVLECLFRRSIFNSIYFELTRGHIGQWGGCVQNAVQLLATFVFLLEMCRSSGRRDISL